MRPYADAAIFATRHYAATLLAAIAISQPATDIVIRH
jgi:hypothetical protein